MASKRRSRFNEFGADKRGGGEVIHIPRKPHLSPETKEALEDLEFCRSWGDFVKLAAREERRRERRSGRHYVVPCAAE